MKKLECKQSPQNEQHFRRLFDCMIKHYHLCVQLILLQHCYVNQYSYYDVHSRSSFNLNNRCKTTTKKEVIIIKIKQLAYFHNGGSQAVTMYHTQRRS